MLAHSPVASTIIKDGYNSNAVVSGYPPPFYSLVRLGYRPCNKIESLLHLLAVQVDIAGQTTFASQEFAPGDLCACLKLTSVAFYYTRCSAYCDSVKIAVQLLPPAMGVSHIQ